MILLVNLVLAWVATLCALACGIVWGLRLMSKWNHPIGTWCSKWNKGLRKSHMPLGILVVATGFLHGLLSSESVWSFNIGTGLWVLTLIIGLTFMWRKRLVKWRGWLYWHRVLTIAIGLLIGIHIVDVGGISLPTVVMETFSPRSMAMQTHSMSLLDETTEISETPEALGTETPDESAETPQETTVEVTPGMEESQPSEPIESPAVVSQSVESQSTTKASSSVTSSQKTETTPNKTETPNSTDTETDKTEATTSKTDATTVQSPAEITAKGPYKDGVYTGEADGYRPGLVVEVTIKEGKIANIQVVSHNERGERFYGPPIAIVPQAIIDKQSTEVDVVSGATYTSIGIMNAVSNALTTAK